MVKAAFIGVGVALLCFLPPIVHFITGPLSPAIGGFVGGMQLPSRKRSLGTIAAMAVLMAAALAILVLAIGSIVVFIVMQIADAGTDIEAILLLPLAGLVFLYTLGFAFLGGLFGSSFRR